MSVASPPQAMIRPRRSVAALALIAAILVTTIAGGPGPSLPGSLGPRAAGAETLDFDTLAANDELTSDHAAVFRLYWAFFGRSPDAGGALYWIGERDRCVGLATIAEWFARSAEFDAWYGHLADAAFVEVVYGNVLERASDPAGAQYWTSTIASGQLTRAGVVLHMSLSEEFVGRHRYPSDGVPARSCLLPDGRPTGRSVHVLGSGAPLATVAGLTITTPAEVVERVGFHQSSHPGAIGMVAADPAPVRMTTMASRNRNTHPAGAADIAVEPTTAIVAPIAGTVARAGNYTLYCRYRDGFVVINPDGRPDLEVKILHITDVAVQAGERVEVGDRIAAHATSFPFQSQIDRLTGEPSWPHVHIEVVDPSVPRRSAGGRC